MTIEAFTRNLELEFEEITPGTLTPSTNYREIEGWSSMHALIVIAFIDTHYDLILNAAELKQTQTILDLYTLVQSKIN
jgi:acyl carrier protein